MSYAIEAIFFALILVSSASISPLAFAQNVTSILPPLKQIKNGVPLLDVKCKEGLVLITKTSDSSPACVKPDTAQKLVELGWGVSKEQMIWFEFDPVQCQQTPWFKYWDKLHSTTAWGRTTPEWYVIIQYFKDQGIPILDVESTILKTSHSVICGQPEKGAYFFLVPKSTSDEMIKLDFKLATPPSYAFSLAH